jgi:hypothetical protein
MRIITADKRKEQRGGAESSSQAGSDEEDQGFKVRNDYTWKEKGGELDFAYLEGWLEDSDDAFNQDSHTAHSHKNGSKAAAELQKREDPEL